MPYNNIKDTPNRNVLLFLFYEIKYKKACVHKKIFPLAKTHSDINNF